MLTNRTHRIVILHGMSADENSDWYKGVATHYQELGYEALIPNFPGSVAPNLDRWCAHLIALLAERNWPIDISLSLIGHSTGVMAAIRFVEGLPDGTVVGPSIFVAGFPAALGLRGVPAILARPVKLDKIRTKLTKVLAIHSSNDWRVPQTPNQEWFERELDAQILVVDRAGHFIKRHGWTDWNKEMYECADRFLGCDLC